MSRLTSNERSRENLRSFNPLKDRKIRSFRTYDDFFEGYVEDVAAKKNGKGNKIVRTYVGEYYSADERKICWPLRKILYVLLFIAGSVLFFLGATVPSGLEVGSAIYKLFILPQVAAVIFAIWTSVALINMLITPAKMTIGELKRSSGSLKTSANAMFWIGFITAVATLVTVFLSGKEFISSALMASSELLVSTALFFTLKKLEERHKYEES